MQIKNIKQAHCVGIGGIGVSALAKILHEKGINVTGSDVHWTKAIEQLEKMQIKIKIGPYQANNLPNNTEILFYTSDEWPNNPEIKAAISKKIPVKSYPEGIGLVLSDQKIIGAAGTHGKTTTTAMIGIALMAAKKDPSIIVGSLLKEIDGNARMGQGPYAIVEADEYRRAFLKYTPQIVVINNIEEDHLNYFKDLEDIKIAFREFAQNVPSNGVIIANGEDQNVRSVLQNIKTKIIWYGKSQNNDLVANNITLKGPTTSFKVLYKGKTLGNFELLIPGLFNVYNALAALAVALVTECDLEAVKKSLAKFKGAWRRFEITGEKNGIVVIDDYAHHPTALKKTLEAARQRYGKRRIVAIFQAHTYDRLQAFFNEFVEALKVADRVIIPPVYSVTGRGEDLKLKDIFNNQSLAKEVAKQGISSVAAPDLESTKVAVLADKKKGDVIMTIGAGNITEISDQIYKAL